jgi:hypothetical protein
MGGFGTVRWRDSGQDVGDVELEVVGVWEL